MRIKPLQRAARFSFLAGLLTVALTAAAAKQPKDMSGLYSQSQLERVQRVYGPNIHGVLFEDVARYLRTDELQTLAATRLLMPLRGPNLQPFDFYAYKGAIEVPAMSVKFLDDMAIATAWLERNGCRKEAVLDYVGILYASDALPPAPLQALPVPSDALDDPWVDDVSQKVLKSAMVFLLLHELAHIHLGHEGYDGISAAEAQAHEAAADRFALQVMRRMRTPPLGITVWFMAASLLDLGPAQQRVNTHPVTGARLQAFARELRHRPGDFIAPENRAVWGEQVVLSLADDLEAIGSGLSDESMRQFKLLRGRTLPVEHLQRACDGARYDDGALDAIKRIRG